MEKTLYAMTVLYTSVNWKLGNHPFAFICMAESTEHAEEQAENSEDNINIVYVTYGHDINMALDEYYNM